MKKDNDKEPAGNLRPEYDFSRMKGGVRGKYAKRFHSGTNAGIELVKAHELVQDTVRLARKVAKGLLAETPVRGSDIARPDVPREHGVYIWRRAKTGRPAYVGSATGKKGLYGRIIEQHLRPSYTKSSFRNAVRADVAPNKPLDERENSVKFVGRNFTLAWYECPDDSRLALAAEALLIAALKPKYNKIRGLRAS